MHGPRALSRPRMKHIWIYPRSNDFGANIDSKCTTTALHPAHSPDDNEIGWQIARTEWPRSLKRVNLFALSRFSYASLHGSLKAEKCRLTHRNTRPAPGLIESLILNVGRASLEHCRDPYKRSFATFR